MASSKGDPRSDFVGIEQVGLAGGPDGTVFANHTFSPPALDGWGGSQIPTSDFRAVLDLSEAAEGLPAGTPIAVGLPWQDPWTDGREATTFLLVVPNLRDTIP
jgi:hypothetical protein